jgi:hypothetical protein
MIEATLLIVRVLANEERRYQANIKKFAETGSKTAHAANKKLQRLDDAPSAEVHLRVERKQALR